jgi:hypothetical protein
VNDSRSSFLKGFLAKGKKKKEKRKKETKEKRKHMHKQSSLSKHFVQKQPAL